MGPGPKGAGLLTRGLPFLLAAQVVLELPGGGTVLAGDFQRRVWQPRRPEKGVSLVMGGAATWFVTNFYRIYLPLRPGAGYSLEFGYRWNRYLHTYGALTYTEHRPRGTWMWHDEYGFLVAEFKLVVPFLRWGPLRSSAVIGLGRAALVGGEERFGGGSLLAGLQAEYFLTRRLTVGLEARVRYVDYTRVIYRLPTRLASGTVDGSNTSLLWLRLALHLGRI